MSTLEVPASIALLLVMVSLAVSLNADDRPRAGGFLHRPALATQTGSVAPDRSGSPALVGANFRITVPKRGVR
jgi:hypothetical protein